MSLRGSQWMTGAFFVLLVLGVTDTSWSGEGGGDESTESDEELRGAGDSARFRVIERIPDPGRESADGNREDGSAPELRASHDVRRAVRDNRWEEAREELRRRVGEMPARLEFLVGYTHFRGGNFGRALKRLSAVRNDLERLGSYATYFAARAAAELGRPHRAVVLASEVPAKSRLYSDALFVVIDNLMAAGTNSDWKRVRDVAGLYLSYFGDEARAAGLRLDLARHHLDRDRWRKAVDQLDALVRDHPLSEEAEAARGAIENHRDDFPDSLDERLKRERLERRAAYYRKLYERHRSRDVIDGLDEELSNWTTGSRGYCRALYWLGKSRSKLREHADAAGRYRQILESCRGVEPFEKKALYLLGESLWNVGKLEEASDTYGTLYERFPDHSFADDALYFTARLARERGRHDRAAELLVRQTSEYPDGDMAAGAHWVRVDRWMDRGEWGRIVQYVEQLDLPVSAEPAIGGRLAYFRGRALERLGKTEEARRQYLDVASGHPLRYYALLAVHRWARLQGREGPDCTLDSGSVCDHLPRTDSDRPDEVRETLRRRRSYRLGQTLLSLGLREAAGREFERLVRQLPEDPSVKAALAEQLLRAEMAPLAIRVTDSIHGWRGAYPSEEGATIWRLAYPRAYSEKVSKWAKRRDLPESFVYAIGRKESRFDPDAKSWATARGMMQLMWSTARRVGSDIGRSDLRKSELLRPSTSLRLGTAYLEDLAERFDGRLVFAAAGYNAGGGTVEEWCRARNHLEIDRWIESIPYDQTRRYVKRVLATRWAYRWLEDAPSVPTLDFEVSAD